MIPFAILSGKLIRSGCEDQEIRILELSPDSFTFRLPRIYEKQEAAPLTSAMDPCCLSPQPESVILHFYDFGSASYREMTLGGFTLTRERTRRFYEEYRLTIDDAGYRGAVKHLTTEYLRYIRLKSEEDDAALSRELSGYPASAEENYPESFDVQKKRWFAPWDRDSENRNNTGGSWSAAALDSCELALSLDRPDVWNRYLELPPDTFVREFWKRNHLESHPVAREKITCLYIGNQFCHMLFPSDALLFRLLDKTCRDGLKAVLAFSYVQENRMEDVSMLLKKLADWCRGGRELELVVNDWGMLSMIREAGYSCFSLTLGLLLQKRRKDVRLGYKRGFDRYGGDLQETSLQAGFYPDYLKDRFHVKRISYESCGYPIKITPGKASLHFPFYQMNTSQYCTLYAGCKNGDRGKQCQITECPEYCRDRVFLYPEFLNMIGRYNSLFGYDTDILTDGDRLSALLHQGVDRIVAEFL